MRKRKQWKSLAAALGIAILVLGENGAVPVRAEEAAQASSSSYTPAAITNLEWNENGQGSFFNPNGNAYVVLYIYCDDELAMTWPVRNSSYGTHAGFDLYHAFQKTGTYTFQAEIWSQQSDGTVNKVLSEKSAGFSYTKPDEQLPTPVVTVTKEGKVTCALPENSAGYEAGTDYGFGYRLYSRSSSGSPEPAGEQVGNNSGVFDFSGQMESGKVYYVRVCTMSRDITKYADSEWSGYIPFDPDAASAVQEEEKGWEPTTPDEIKRYTARGSEEVKYTADEKNAYTVTVLNSVQGEKCFESFDAVLGDYTIARTYNILPSGEFVYQMDSKARITLNIPETLQADGRKFRMLCVTENGRPVVLEDLDSDARTITFETDTYYAFALVYKDAQTSK